jgi:hypothetical protein
VDFWYEPDPVLPWVRVVIILSVDKYAEVRWGGRGDGGFCGGRGWSAMYQHFWGNGRWNEGWCIYFFFVFLSHQGQDGISEAVDRPEHLLALLFSSSGQEISRVLGVVCRVWVNLLGGIIIMFSEAWWNGEWFVVFLVGFHSSRHNGKRGRGPRGAVNGDEGRGQSHVVLYFESGGVFFRSGVRRFFRKGWWGCIGASHI